jgi:hypothetical protein
MKKSKGADKNSIVENNGAVNNKAIRPGSFEGQQEGGNHGGGASKGGEFGNQTVTNKSIAMQRNTDSRKGKK